MLKFLLRKIGAFRRDTRGSYTVEAMLVLPALVWANVGTYTYFDAFNTIDTNIKATYTLADMISRQTETVTPNYILGMNKMFDYLNHTSGNTWVRITNVSYDSSTKSYKVVWSYGTHGEAARTTGSLTQIQSQLPNMASGDTLIVVETHLYYTPPFDIGLAARNLDELIVTRPRLAPQVVYSGS